MALFTPKIPLYLAGGAVFPWDKSLVHQFTTPSPYPDEPAITLFREFTENGERFLRIPRNCCPVPEDNRTDEGIAVKFNSTFQEGKEGQQALIGKSVFYLQQGVSHIVQAPTGYGKTFCALEIIARMGVRTLVITTKEDIVEQWFAAAKSVLGLERKSVGLWRAATCDVVGKSLVIGLVHSILKGPIRYGPAAFKGFGLVIWDECHRVPAEQFSQSVWWLPAKLRLGLSATPTRKDGRGVLLQAHIGEIKVVAKQEVMIPRVLVARTGWKVPRIASNGRVVQLPHKPGKTMHLHKIMGRDKKRNEIISSFVGAAYRKGRNIIVFSDLIEHLEILKKGFIEKGVLVKDIGFYVGLTYYRGSEEQKKTRREQAKHKPVILASYKMASEATDIPWLDTCVLGTPRSDVIQIVGRIRREYPDKKTAVVFDLVDSDSPVFEAYAGKRYSWYRDLGAEIKIMR